MREKIEENAQKLEERQIMFTDIAEREIADSESLLAELDEIEAQIEGKKIKEMVV